MESLEFIINCYEKCENVFKNEVVDADFIISSVFKFIQPKFVEIAVIGPEGVGKSGFIRRLLGNEFDESYEPNKCKKISFLFKKNTIFEFIEFSGFDGKKGFDYAILMIDDSEKAFEDISMLKIYESIIYICTKIDIPDKKQKFIDENIIYISSRTGEGVQEVFKRIK